MIFERSYLGTLCINNKLFVLFDSYYIEIMEKINWQSLAERVGAISQPENEIANLNNFLEIGSSDLARRAIEVLIGENNLRDAVDYYISGQPGCELVRHILWQLHSWTAMEYCYEIYRSTSRDLDSRRMAIELLRVVGDRRALIWIDEFLEDGDEYIQRYGIDLLDRLLSSDLIYPENARNLLAKSMNHRNSYVREKANDLVIMIEADEEE